MISTDPPFTSGRWDPPVQGSPAEEDAARRQLARIAERLHDGDPRPLELVLAALGLDEVAA